MSARQSIAIARLKIAFVELEHREAEFERMRKDYGMPDPELFFIKEALPRAQEEFRKAVKKVIETWEAEL